MYFILKLLLCYRQIQSLEAKSKNEDLGIDEISSRLNKYVTTLNERQEQPSMLVDSLRNEHYKSVNRKNPIVEIKRSKGSKYRTYTSTTKTNIKYFG